MGGREGESGRREGGVKGGRVGGREGGSLGGQTWSVCYV